MIVANSETDVVNDLIILFLFRKILISMIRKVFILIDLQKVKSVISKELNFLQ